MVLQPPGEFQHRAPGLYVTDYREGKFAKHNFYREEPATWLVKVLKYFTQLDH
jgi:hypothetical protein